MLLERMDDCPYDFIISARDTDLERLSGFVHRTFNGSDCIYFIKGLGHIYSQYNSMEDVLLEGMSETGSLKKGLSHLRSSFFELPHASGNEKHFANITGGSSGKHLNMFLRIIKDSN